VFPVPTATIMCREMDMSVWLGQVEAARSEKRFTRPVARRRKNFGRGSPWR
jgi:hypothetical protein